jgi:cell division control protein 7
VPDISEQGMTWRQLVLKLHPSVLDDQESDEDRKIVNDALDLLEKCLHPEPPRRFTAREALYHPFLLPHQHTEDDMEEEEDEQDDAMFVHPPGRGACASLHRKDDVTGTWHALVPRDDAEVEIDLDDDENADSGTMVWKALAPGEGLCIGWHACALHYDAVLPHYEWDPTKSSGG